MSAKVFVGNIIHCPKPFELEVIKDGFIIVKEKKIIALDTSSKLSLVKQQLDLKNAEEIHLTKSQLLLPGLIDTHIHAAQYPNCGLGYDKPLLEWLDNYTYKLEKQYKDLELCKKVFQAIVKKTLSYGTTTAMYFASLYGNSSMVLANSAIEHGQRAFIGKINMTQLAPQDYMETAEETITNTVKFIEELKNKNSDLVQPVITPRFALSVDINTMKKLGELARKYNLNIQTHISENKDELNLVNKLYEMPYAHVYNVSDLLTPKTVLAHGIHLFENEIKLLAEKGTSISHCPDSNTCLKSGICDVRKLVDAGVKVGLGTDVAGGPSPSIISTMRTAIQSSIHLSYEKKDYKSLNYSDVFYLATLGGAEALALDDKIGNFKIGKEFDAILVDVDVEDCAADYLMDCNPLEVLQKFIFLGDDRNVKHAYVAGKCVK